MNLPDIKTAPDLSGKFVMVRVDWNVPLEDGKVADDFRIRKSMSTIEVLQKAGAKILLISHFENKEGHSLLPVFDHLKESHPISFSATFFSEEARKKRGELRGGEMLLFENLRSDPGEKSNDDDFAKRLAELADIYVNDAFSVSHREHASVVGVPKYIPSYAGIQLQDEVSNLSRAFNPDHPFLFILGGAKFDTKIPLVRKFLPRAEKIFIGGALSNDIFKAKGLTVGDSLVSDAGLDFSDLIDNEKIMIPSDVLVRDTDMSAHRLPEGVKEGEVIVDAGPQTISDLQKEILKANFVLWNGPLGNYELGYKMGTLGLAKAIAQSRKQSVVGGGDTLAAIEELDILDKFSFVSTGGGAMLDFLANETLPGIEALTP